MSIYQYDHHTPKIDKSSYVHEQATIIGQVVLATGTSVWPQAVLRGDNERIDIGDNSNIQDGAILHTDPGYPIIIGEQVTIGHQAVLHGCVVGEGSLIGIQAVVLNGAVIGKNCLVAAGSVVTERKIFPDNSLILGSPAKVVKVLSDEAIHQLRENAEHYVEKARQYKTKLVKLR